MATSSSPAQIRSIRVAAAPEAGRTLPRTVQAYDLYGNAAVRRVSVSASMTLDEVAAHQANRFTPVSRGRVAAYSITAVVFVVAAVIAAWGAYGIGFAAGSHNCTMH